MGEGATLFHGLLHFTLDLYLIMLSVKQGGIKYHFLSLWYDSTWDWTPVHRRTLYWLGQWRFKFGVFLLLVSCHIKVKEPNLPYYLPIVGWRKVRCISFSIEKYHCTTCTSKFVWPTYTRIYIYKEEFW